MTRRVTLVAVAAVVLIAAGGLVWLLTMRPDTPEEAALSYLHALEAGDPGAAQRAGAAVSDAAASAFDGAVEHPSEPVVTAAAEHGDTAEVAVAFRLDGERHEATLPMFREGGAWTVREAATGRVSVASATGSFVAVGGAVFPTDSPADLLPGLYEVQAAPVALLDGEARVLVLPGGTASVVLDSAVRPEAADLAQERLDAYAQECAAPAAAVPEACGIAIPWAADLVAVSGIRYRIEQSPVLTLDPTGFRAEGGVLVATVTGTGHDGAERSVTYRNDRWALFGDVSFTADDLVLSVRGSVR